MDTDHVSRWLIRPGGANDAGNIFLSPLIMDGDHPPPPPRGFLLSMHAQSRTYDIPSHALPFLRHIYSRPMVGWVGFVGYIYISIYPKERNLSFKHPFNRRRIYPLLPLLLQQHAPLPECISIILILGGESLMISISVIIIIRLPSLLC